MGYTQPWYSVRGVAAPVGGEMGHLLCFLRDGDRVFLTYSTTGRGNEPANGSLALLDMTPYGRREAWQDDPEGWPEAPDAGAPVGGHGSPISCTWRSDADGVATWGPTSRPVPQWTRPGATSEDTLGRTAATADASRPLGPALERPDRSPPGRCGPALECRSDGWRRPAQRASSALRMRVSETAYAVPRDWSHSETRYSSSIQRTRTSPADGGRPSGSASTRCR